jgi:hypothetical protein
MLQITDDNREQVVEVMCDSTAENLFASAQMIGKVGTNA